jgi:hypothetical protein
MSAVVKKLRLGLLTHSGGLTSISTMLCYAAYALLIGTYVGADAEELDQVAKAHLALVVHAALLDEVVAQERSRCFGLYSSAVLRRGVLGRGSLTYSRQFAYSSSVKGVEFGPPV